MFSLRFYAKGALLALLVACGGRSANDDPSPVSSAGATSIGGSGGTGATGGMEPASGGAGGALAGAAGVAAGGSEGESLIEVLPSSGCGLEPPGAQAFGAFSDYNVHATGATLTDLVWPEHDRGYHVRLPPDYDSNTAYPVVFWGCECGGDPCTGDAVIVTEGDAEKIYVGMDVAPEGVGDQAGCYGTTYLGFESPDWEFFGLIAAEVQERFCVDTNRVYAAGGGPGGDLAITTGCYFAGFDPDREFGPAVSVRGHLAVAGHGVAPDPLVLQACDTPVAGMWIYDESDTQAWDKAGQEAFDRVLERNGCTDSPSEPWGTINDGECLRYTACPTDYPVVFCTTQGRGHGWQLDNSVPGFTQFMDLMKPR